MMSLASSAGQYLAGQALAGGWLARTGGGARTAAFSWIGGLASAGSESDGRLLRALYWQRAVLCAHNLN
jgi:hypothetical protein